MVAVTRTPAEQLALRTMPVPFCGCVVWLGGTTSRGYGKLTYRYKTISAHRASWEERYGPVPAGKVVCHKCDIPSCVNPDHLFIGTNQDNSDDMKAKRRQVFGEKTHCAKLNEHDVRHIRRTDIGTTLLADIYEISTTTIKAIRKRKTWSHVQE